MNLPPEIITLALSAVAVIVWGVRLEGRVNSVDKDVVENKVSISAANARADAEAIAHRATADSLIRVEERLKYVCEMLERHFVVAEPEAPIRRRTRVAP
jgi:hypothetical protein